jgi:hypothetical protein
MRLSSQSSQFVFNLPPDFIPQEVIQSYTPILEKNWIQYENVIDYLNSTIKNVSFPGISFETPMQHLIRGKERMYKPSKNIQDIVGHDITITFASVDADINYWIIFDIISKHYLDTDHLYVYPFTITAVDIHRDGIYRISFREIILKGLSDNKFDYGQQKVSSKEFTLTFHYNFYDIEFLLDNSKVLELGTVPTIIQKI